MKEKEERIIFKRSQSSDVLNPLIASKNHNICEAKVDIYKSTDQNAFSQKESLPGLNPNERVKNTKKIVSAEYYHSTYLMGEELHDEDDDYEGTDILELHPCGYCSKTSSMSSHPRCLTIDETGNHLQSHIQKLGPLQTFFTLTKGFVGTTFLLFPNGFYNAGWLFGIATVLVVGSLVIISTNLLLTVSERYPGSFSSLGERSLGKPGKIFCDLALGLTQTGFVCMHIVFISQNVNGILQANFGFMINKWVIGVICLTIYAPLTWVRRIQYFAKFHIFAVIIVITALVVILFCAVDNFEHNEIQTMNKSNWAVFVGTCVFAFEGVTIVLPVKNTTRNPKQFRLILTCMLAVISLLLIGFGLVNYMAYSNERLAHAKLITRLLPSQSPIVQIVEVLFILNLFISYPLAIYPTNIIIEKNIYKSMSQKPLRKWLKNCNRTVLVALTFFMGLYFEESLDRLTSIVGSLFLTNIAFTLPAIFHLCLIAKSPIIKTFDYCLIFFGFLLTLLITGYTLTH
ncbi:unnamed protein product [Moneuplotes crassus]|uniref:Amino acid transporter transmembrane domain-containing protein n=1 Tax=Euplotes crassus TaxID=5936 RepID=A0AAD1U8U8_EUPCR|nr:unnamed protein product [Moneuplotes crassus]